METQSSSPESRQASNSSANEDISGFARFMIGLFVLVFIGFGLVLISDLLSGLWR